VVYPGCVHRVLYHGGIPRVHTVVYILGYMPSRVPGRCTYWAICLPRYMVGVHPGIYASLYTLGTPTIPGTLLVAVLHSGCATLGVQGGGSGLKPLNN